MIGSSTGEQYETDYDTVVGRPLGASTEATGALKSSEGTSGTPGNIDLTQRPIVPNPDGSFSTVRSMSFNEDAIKHYRDTGQHLGKFGTVQEADAYAEQLHKDQEGQYQKKIDELVAAAPNFANSSVIDQMSATAGRSRPEVPITVEKPMPKAPGSASAAQEGSDMSEVAARPRDPSVDSFIDRYGVWNIHDKIIKDEEDKRIENEVNREGYVKSIRPGTKTWPRGNVISELDIERYRELPPEAIRELEADRAKQRKIDEEAEKANSKTRDQLKDDELRGKMSPSDRIKYYDAIKKRIMSDASPDSVEAGQQYAMMKTKDVSSHPGVEGEKLAGATAWARGQPRLDVKNMQEYLDKVPMDQRISGKAGNITHPGFRWQVTDKEGNPVGNSYANRVRARGRMDKLDNEYGSYHYRLQQVPAKESQITDKEFKMMKDLGLVKPDAER